MNRQAVCIVIPTFNRARYVGWAIESSLGQTHGCQVVVCDHGSTDETPEVVGRYQGRVTYIRREKDLGPHFCWLEGVLNSDAEFVHIQYDDDWIEPTFIERTLAMMQEDVGFAFTEALEFDEASGRSSPSFNLAKRFSPGLHDAETIERMLMKGGMISPGACLFRKRDVVDALFQGRLPLLEEDSYHGVGPDVFMSLLCLLRYRKVGIVLDPLAIFRVHAGSITIHAQGDQDKRARMKRAYDATRAYYKLLKLHRKHGILRWLSAPRSIGKSVERQVKLALRALGLRKKEVRPL